MAYTQYYGPHRPSARPACMCRHLLPHNHRYHCIAPSPPWCRNVVLGCCTKIKHKPTGLTQHCLLHFVAPWTLFPSIPLDPLDPRNHSDRTSKNSENHNTTRARENFFISTNAIARNASSLLSRQVLFDL